MKPGVSKPVIHLAYSTCGNRGGEGLLGIQTAILSSSTDNVMHIHVFWDATPILRNAVVKPLTDYVAVAEGEVFLYFHTIDANTWFNKMFRPCAMNRLYIPQMLPDVEKLIYIDTDTLVVGDLGKLWDEFKHFTPSTVFGFTLEAEGPGGGYASQTRLKTYYGDNGINSGVALIHIKNWPSDLDAHIERVAKTATPEELKVGDQDVLNIVLHSRPELVHVLPCSWNLRPWSYWLCKSPPWSRTIIHGSDGTFYDTDNSKRKEIFTNLYKFAKAFTDTTGVDAKKPVRQETGRKRGASKKRAPR